MKNERQYELRAESADLVRALVRQLGMAELTELTAYGVDVDGQPFQFSVTADDTRPPVES